MLIVVRFVALVHLGPALCTRASESKMTDKPLTGHAVQLASTEWIQVLSSVLPHKRSHQRLANGRRYVSLPHPAPPLLAIHFPQRRLLLILRPHFATDVGLLAEPHAKPITAARQPTLLAAADVELTAMQRRVTRKQ